MYFSCLSDYLIRYLKIRYIYSEFIFSLLRNFFIHRCYFLLSRHLNHWAPTFWNDIMLPKTPFHLFTKIHIIQWLLVLITYTFSKHCWNFIFLFVGLHVLFSALFEKYLICIMYRILCIAMALIFLNYPMTAPFRFCSFFFLWLVFLVSGGDRSIFSCEFVNIPEGVGHDC